MVEWLGCSVVEGSDEHCAGWLVDTGLTANKHISQLLTAFDVCPDNADMNTETATCDDQTLNRSVHSILMRSSQHTLCNSEIHASAEKNLKLHAFACLIVPPYGTEIMYVCMYVCMYALTA